MSVYKNDNAIHFERALDSITELQTVKPSEIVLVVDGPIGDELNAVITKYEKKYDFFKAIMLTENKGLGKALKVAVENCRYELVARMDSDDVAVSDRFEQQLRYFADDSECAMVGGDVTEFIDSEDNLVGKRSVPTTHGEIIEYMKSRCAFNHPTVMFKKSSVEKAGGYIDWYCDEDYYLWLRMFLSGCRMANTGTVLVNVRVGKEMYKRRGGWKYFKSEKALQKYMKKHKIIPVCFDENGVPMMYVFEGCEAFRRTMPLLQFSKTDPEDLDSDGEDHVADEVRYTCMMLPLRSGHCN
jgi:glycosyltransferase involved in cell wall biosynthesis